ncbi:hypothetical protein QAD02_012489 [Eretmocerus hayati]|uniref:Uncharacterized protein n=1 Tax=Eretmocerus hayati TaxID=131215 RepID=A0ACC2NZZ3_9HYME|nr:hypothetical protein QAD02_012489 [Eretmocerus hayati]
MNLTLPLKDESSWNDFDDELLQNDEFKSIFVRRIRTLYDGLGNKPTKSCTNILKMVFTKKLLEERFNPFRSDEEKDKIAFSDSAMYSVMIARIIYARSIKTLRQIFPRRVFPTGCGKEGRRERDENRKWDSRVIGLFGGACSHHMLTFCVYGSTVKRGGVALDYQSATGYTTSSVTVYFRQS